jgi:hypothetical protein
MSRRTPIAFSRRSCRTLAKNLPIPTSRDGLASVVCCRFPGAIPFVPDLRMIMQNDAQQRAMDG